MAETFMKQPQVIPSLGQRVASENLEGSGIQLHSDRNGDTSNGLGGNTRVH
jgi:hypothetical protein